MINESYAKSTIEDSQSDQSCIRCHTSSVKAWQKSDHAKSMALPDKNSILADFNNTDIEHYGQKAHFFIKDNEYQVTISYNKNIDQYPIKYTFGYFPVQQYLVETEKGKLQVLPFAWDARTKENGGQRWYHNYSHEEIRSEDRLHWRQPLQNWNGMCADCHSDGLIRNYDAEEDSFTSNFENINIGCVSCHGDMSEHAIKDKISNVAKDITLAQATKGQWIRDVNDKTAQWHGKKRDNNFMDNCFSCHSLRSPLTDGIKPNTAFLNQFMPQLPSTPNYYPDGQINEEVYVYGSFLQSKMYSKGVNCLDCHDKHTMKLKIEGNGLCLQCHSGDVYNVKSHHQHELASSGSECVNCHMPSKVYMGVDDRRDHSFKVPRPELSSPFNTPNACTQCHDNKSNEWASEHLEKWHGKPKGLLQSKYFLMALNNGQEINLEDHLSIISDNQLDIISRASALQMLSFTTKMITIGVLKPYLEHPESLLRLSAANAALLLTPAERVIHLTPLLVDEFKAIRVAAARNLVASKMPAKNQQAFEEALSELFDANELSSWRGEGRANQGAIAIETNDFLAAEKYFRGSIKIEPYFEAGYINLADVYRVQQRSIEAAEVLVEGTKNLPKSAVIKYAYGLHLVRQKNYVNAVTLFEEAVHLSPENSQYAYTLVLALDGIGHSKKALSKLKTLILDYEDKAKLKELGLYLSQKGNNKADYDWFIKL